MNKNKKYYFIGLCSLLLITSCKFKNSDNPTAPTPVTKTVHYVASMISSSNSPNPLITYSDQSGTLVQQQQMSLDVVQTMATGLTASLSATCSGTYNAIQTQSNASIALKIFVNDTLKAESNDLKTDPTAAVTASANCSYTIK